MCACSSLLHEHCGYLCYGSYINFLWKIVVLRILLKNFILTYLTSEKFLLQQGVIHVLIFFFMNAAFIAIILPAESTGPEKSPQPKRTFCTEVKIERFWLRELWHKSELELSLFPCLALLFSDVAQVTSSRHFQTVGNYLLWQ